MRPSPILSTPPVNECLAGTVRNGEMVINSVFISYPYIYVKKFTHLLQSATTTYCICTNC